MNTNLYYVSTDGQAETGPYHLAQVKALFSSGRITVDTPVRVDGDSRATTAGALLRESRKAALSIAAVVCAALVALALVASAFLYLQSVQDDADAFEAMPPAPRLQSVR